MIPAHRLEQINQRFQFLEASMSDGTGGSDIAALAKEYSDLKPVVEQIIAYRHIISDMEMKCGVVNLYVFELED